jgi:hypothetical protein
MFGHKEGGITGLAFYDNRSSNIKDHKMLSCGQDGALLVWDYYRAFRKEEIDDKVSSAFKIPIYSPKPGDKDHPLTAVSIYQNPNDSNEVYVITTTDTGNIIVWELTEDENTKLEKAKVLE